MGDWSLKGKVSRVANTGAWETIDTASSANTKSAAWVEMVDSTAVGGLLNVSIMTPTQPADVLLDIAIGAAGSEQILINNLCASFPVAALYRIFSPYTIPIYIPAGTRLSAKSQSTYNGTSTISVNLELVEATMFGAEAPLAFCDTYGATTADSGGTSIDPGATANTKGAWVPLTAASTRTTKALILAIGGNNDTSRATCTWYVDIGVGAEGAEQVIAADLMYTCITTSDVPQPGHSPLYGLEIPAGTRISVRAKCTINTAGDRLFDAIIYAFG
jgi:hypothetical protein